MNEFVNQYFDWSAGFTKSLGNFAVSLKWVDGSDFSNAKTPGHIFESRGKVLATVSTTLPWASE